MLVFTPPPMDLIRDDIETSVHAGENISSISEYLKESSETNLNKGSQFINKQEFLRILERLNSRFMFTSNPHDIIDSKDFKYLVQNGTSYITAIFDHIDHNEFLVWALNEITGMKIADSSLSMEDVVREWKKWAINNGYYLNLK
jgi:hypothetical protein